MMNEKRFAVPAAVCSLSLLVAAVCAALLLSAGRSVRAGEGGEDKPGSQVRWEYCAVSDVGYTVEAGGKTVNTAKICYYQHSGCRERVVEGASEREALARGVATLGEEGWEMIGEGPFNSDTRKLGLLYFKRRRP